MKNTLLPISLLVVAAMLTPLEAGADAPITMDQFLKLPADKRMEVCLQRVASENLGACMNLKHSDKPAAHASSEKIELEMMRCTKGTDSGTETGFDSGTEMGLGACARDRLNRGLMKSHQFTETQFQAAERVCSKRAEASTDRGACMAAVLPHIDREGNYH